MSLLQAVLALALIMLLAGPGPGAAGTAVANVRPGAEGDILAWLGGEAAARPREGDSFEAEGRQFRWALHLARDRRGLDFRSIWHGEFPAVAYAYAEVHCPQESDAVLLLGSDDGVKVWVNGELRHVSHVARGVRRDEDRVVLRLRRGGNRLLFKVDQGRGGWGLVARLTDSSGRPPAGALFKAAVLTEQDEADAARAFVRQAAGRGGSLDASAAMQWVETQRKASRWLERFRDVADEPERLEAALAAAGSALEAGRGASADALTEALRSSVAAVGSLYDRSRARFLREMQEPPPLFPTDPAREDYLTVAPGGRYFQHSDGRPFIPIGYNHNPDWPGLVQSNPQSDDYDPQRTERFFARLAGTGVNTIRMMVETPPSGWMEDPLGTFVPEHIRWLDHVFTAARRHGVRLIVIPYDTFWMNMRWDVCQFNPELGGPLERKTDFLTSTLIRELQKKRMKLLIDRYGNLGEVLCWELMNEIDLWWDATPRQIIQWTEDMAAFVRDYEKKKWGRNHLICVSTAAAMPRGALAGFAYRSPHLDFATTHLYIGASNAPVEPVEPALNIAEGVRYALGQIRDARPYLDSENGPIDRWITDPDLDVRVFHHMSWSHLASGGCGSSLRWPYRHPHHLSDGQFEALARMARFVEEAPWARITGPYSAGPAATPAEDCIAMASGSREAGIAWAARRDGKRGVLAFTVTWPGGSARIRYRPYDTQTGVWLPEGRSDESGHISLEDAPPSLAFILERLED